MYPKRQRVQTEAQRRAVEKRNAQLTRERRFWADEDAAMNSIHRLVGENYNWTAFNHWASKNTEWQGAEGIPSDDDVTWRFIYRALKVYLETKTQP